MRRGSKENNVIKTPAMPRSVNCLLFSSLMMDIYLPTANFQVSQIEYNPHRKNFMMNSMEQFRDIMKQTNIEMEREVDRMPIGTFQ